MSSKTLAFAKKYLFPLLSSFELFPLFEQLPETRRFLVVAYRKTPVLSFRILQTLPPFYQLGIADYSSLQRRFGTKAR